MRDIGWRAKQSQFVDLELRLIRSVFKLYPWEWLLNEQSGDNAVATMDSKVWIEPMWKMLWSNKALLAILWELNCGHELLLPAYLDGPRSMSEIVQKPLLGQEGAGFEVFGAHGTSYPRGRESTAVVYQQLASLAKADG